MQRNAVYLTKVTIPNKVNIRHLLYEIDHDAWLPLIDVHPTVNPLDTIKDSTGQIAVSIFRMLQRNYGLDR